MDAKHRECECGKCLKDALIGNIWMMAMGMFLFGSCLLLLNYNPPYLDEIQKQVFDFVSFIGMIFGAVLFCAYLVETIIKSKKFEGVDL